MSRYLFVFMDSKPIQLYGFRNQCVVNNQKLVSFMVDMYDHINVIYNQNCFH